MASRLSEKRIQKTQEYTLNKGHIMMGVAVTQATEDLSRTG